jgi:HEAT repeat protein
MPRVRAFASALAISLAVLPFASCSDRTDEEVRGYVALVVNQEGSAVIAAAEKLARYGRRAIPTIESAMHTANPSGRKNLILTLRKIADPEAVPLLGHIAANDPAPDVRREAEWTLKQWAATGAPALAERAKAALRALDEARSTEEAG